MMHRMINNKLISFINFYTIFVMYFALYCSHYWRNYDIKESTDSGLNRVSILQAVRTILNYY